MNIFVASLNYKTTERALQLLFENFGVVDKVKIIKDRETQKSKGFGFVEMPDREEGQAACKALHKAEFDGRNIIVQEAEDKPKKGR